MGLAAKSGVQSYLANDIRLSHFLLCCSSEWALE